MTAEDILLCYNRGCGQRFNSKENEEDSCAHHPGAPVFHDAYKGWSCCKKKCTDFTEFLNIPGCTRSFHSNVKPVEPEKPAAEKVVEVPQMMNQPVKPPALERPPFDAPLIKLKTSISPSLQRELGKLVESNPNEGNTPTLRKEITVGTLCKHGGCNETYVNESSKDLVCNYHPGVPIFHEGLKYWTCCTKRTTDFQAFLNQVGCNQGTHLWEEDQENSPKVVQCRTDWMQTGTHITVNVYCKKYDPRNEALTYVEVNPIRLRIRIFFPETGLTYDSDQELRGVVDTINSSVTFSPTKVEIKLKKAEPMSWTRLDIVRPKVEKEASHVKKEETTPLPSVDAIDLSDI